MAVGITVMGLSAVANIWIFLVANLAAGAAAGFAFRAVQSRRQVTSGIAENFQRREWGRDPGAA